ncbi:ran-binding protein 3-like isoform X3 [Scylla paramamosain]|uniref:ran-binding protein 3-like isoform X3 n=1 Tax=Scylla paramamosain TaxID=85552 RepID=UPI0030835872
MSCVAPEPTMQPDKHKEGTEADQSKGEDMSSPSPPASSASSSSSSTTTSSSSSSSVTTVTTTTTTTTTSSPSSTSSSSSSSSSSTTTSSTRGTHAVSDVSSTGSSSSNSSADSSSVNSSNRVSPAIGVSSSSVGTSLSSPGMGNPFARAAPHASWGSTESCEQRPILAPSRLSSQTDSGSKVTSSGVLRPSSLGASGRLGGPLRPAAGTSFFPPPTLTVTGSSPPQAAKSEFKLKPSVLGSPNPFAKPVPESPGEKPEGGREGSSRTVGSNNQQEDGTSPVSGSQCQAPSSTPAATTTPSKDVAQGTRTPTQTQDTKSTSRSQANSNSSNSSTPGNNSITTTSTIGARSLFLPLSRTSNNSDSTSSPTLSSSFIFGQNLHSKVASGAATNSSGGSSGGGGGGGGGWGLATDAAAPTTNGEKPTGNLFSEAVSEVSRWSEGAAGGGGAAAGASLTAAGAAAGATTNGQPHTGNLFSEAASEISRPGEEHQAWGSGQSLAESSRELTEKEKSQKRKFDEVEVITGEENESNVLQMNCRLYAWVSGWWQERGRGILRLNDWDAGDQQGGAEATGGSSGRSKEIRSRLVFRTQGTLTVMLNTKVWADMSVERVSSKNVRFTALDADGQPKIFIAAGSPKDADLLHNSLEWRVAALRAHTQEETTAESTKKAKTDDNTSPAVPL